MPFKDHVIDAVRVCVLCPCVHVCLHMEKGTIVIKVGSEKARLVPRPFYFPNSPEMSRAHFSVWTSALRVQTAVAGRPAGAGAPIGL